MIVDALVEYKHPVTIYIPPNGELRGCESVALASRCPNASQPLPKGIMKCFVAKCFCWRHGVPRPKAHTFCRKPVCCLPFLRGRKGQTHIVFLNVHGFFGLGTPGLRKNTLPKNNFGIPSIGSKQRLSFCAYQGPPRGGDWGNPKI